MESHETAATPSASGKRISSTGKNILLPLAWTAIYLLCMIPRAIRKPLWYDELFTWYTAQLPTLQDIWLSLRSGSDPNPPLHYLLLHVIGQILGTGPLATRLPSILGYLLMSLCLYKFTRRRLGRAPAGVAASFPLLTDVSFYATEARAYGLVLGFGALALLCWQEATETAGRRRLAALVGLTLSLAVTVSSHYFAVLLFIPIGLGELTRTILRRRIDFPLWAALIAGLFPLWILREFLKNATAYKSGFWSKPTWTFWLQCYALMFRETIVPLILLIVILAIIVRYSFRKEDAAPAPERKPEPASFPWHEFVTALGFVALPLIGLAFSKIVAGGAFTERYTLATIFGFTLLVAYLSARLADHQPCVGIMIAVYCLVWFVAMEFVYSKRERDPHYRVLAADYSAVSKSDQPLIFTWPLMFLQAHHELPESLVKQTYYLTRGESTEDFALKKLNVIHPLNVVDLEDFVQKHRQFYLCGFPGDGVFQELIKSKAQVRFLGTRLFRGSEVSLALVDVAP